MGAHQSVAKQKRKSPAIGAARALPAVPTQPGVVNPGSIPSRSDNFALLGEENRPTATKLSHLADVIGHDSVYDVLKYRSQIWIRCRDMMATPRELATIRHATVTVADQQPVRSTAAVARFESSEYGSQHYTHHIPLPMDEIAEGLRAEDMGTPSPSGWERLSRALFHAPRGCLTSVLMDHVLRKCFQWYPTGQAWIFGHNGRFETRFSQLRVLRVASVYNIPDIAPETPDSLSGWQHDMPSRLFGLLMNWASVLLFPTVSGMVFGPFGLSLVFVHDDLGSYEPPRFPLSLLDLKHGASEFGQERSGLRTSGRTLTINKQHYLGRYVWEDKTDSAAGLLGFIAERAERFLRASSDLTNFERDVDGHLQIDLVLAQEQLWTMGRILRRTLHLQSAESRWMNRAAVFEIADQWGELAAEWNAVHPVGFFKQLFHPVEGSDRVVGCLAGMPEPWRTRFTQACRAAYAQVQQVARGSVWARRRVTSAGVNVSPNASKPMVESWPDFTVNLLRDLRNTHHGYMPDEKRHPKTRSRLVLSTGEWAPALTFLPSLWLLAFLADPSRFLNWPMRANGW